MSEAKFRLSISKEKYFAYYKNQIKYIKVITDDGLSLQFNAYHLRPFLSDVGIVGEFLLHYDKNKKFISLEKISE